MMGKALEEAAAATSNTGREEDLMQLCLNLRSLAVQLVDELTLGSNKDSSTVVIVDESGNRCQAPLLSAFAPIFSTPIP